jgi:hypothetical protein
MRTADPIGTRCASTESLNLGYINEPENFFKTFLQPARFDTWQTPCCQQAWLNFLPGQVREASVGDAGLD